MFKQLVITFAMISLFAVIHCCTGTDRIQRKKKKKNVQKAAVQVMGMHRMKMAQWKWHKHMDSEESIRYASNEMQMKSDSEEVSIVREGEIDLVAIDVNGDGMVYQDQMCWNVISDEPGECPQCGMTLKEVSLEKAKENLQKNDYKVK